MKNRAKLLAKRKAGHTKTPLLRKTAKLQADEQLKQRYLARKQLAKQTDRHQDVQKQTRPHVDALISVAIKRLKQQLGKPYIWGGETPDTGFDCSGLVNYAYNHLLNRKLPRTAHAMFVDNGLKRVSQKQLKRGDLLFFSIRTQDKADHVGVYLGGGEFIQAPRTGLTIRISQLSDSYWQNHYLGAKRISSERMAL